MDIRMWLKPIRIILLVLLIISLSGCLGSGSTSELDLQNMSEEELESRADDLQQGAVEHPHFLNGGVTTTTFNGVEQVKPDYVRMYEDGTQVEGSLYNGTPDDNLVEESQYNRKPDGDSNRIESYFVWGNPARETIRVKMDNQTYTVQNVTPTPEETYNVSLPNRSRWRYQDYMDEGREIALSEIKSAEARSDDDLAIHLDPSKGLVTEYINKQYNSLVGKRELNLSPSNFESANATLMLDVQRCPSGGSPLDRATDITTALKHELNCRLSEKVHLTANGMSGLNVSLVGENKSVSSDFVVTSELINR